MAHLPITAAAIAAAVSFSALSFVIAGEPDRAAKQDRLQPRAALVERIQSQAQAGLNLCGERESMVADLADQFHEAPLATGLVDDKAVLEIFVSSAGSWTILATGTDGKSCVMAVGEGFEPVTQTVGAGA